MSALRNVSDLDWQAIYANRVRAIEELYGDIHADLLEWGRWGRERYPGRPRLMLSGIWRMPGDGDPNRDPTAAPSAKPDPIDERSVLQLDAGINATDFPAIWAKVLTVNYVGALTKRGYVMVPEYQRPDAAHMGPENFIEQLANSLDFLRG